MSKSMQLFNLSPSENPIHGLALFQTKSFESDLGDLITRFNLLWRLN